MLLKSIVKSAYFLVIFIKMELGYNTRSFIKFGALYLGICMFIGTYLAIIVAFIFFSFASSATELQCWVNVVTDQVLSS